MNVIEVKENVGCIKSEKVNVGRRLEWMVGQLQGFQPGGVKLKSQG